MATGDGGGPPGVAVVGCGLWGRNHVRTYAALGALRAVVDRKPAAAAAEAAAYGVAAKTFDEALADPAVAAVAFALPPSQNVPMATAALRAGKHVFVEKPMAMTGAEAAELCAVAEAVDRRLMVGHILRHHPAFQALLALVRAGELGPILSISSRRLDLGRIRREEDALWALAPHDVSMVLALAGAEPERVDAFGGWHTHPTIADDATVDLRFPGGTRAEIRVSWLHPVKEQRLVVVGRDAMAVFDDAVPEPTRKLTLHRHGVRERDGLVETVRAAPEPVPFAPVEPLRAECLAFLDSVRTGRPAETDGREGAAVLRVLERASAALLARRAEERIDP